MTNAPMSELARVLSQLAEIVATSDPDAYPLVARARALCRPLHQSDPARWTVSEQIVTVEADVPASVVVETLANERIGAALVLSSEGPIGIAAERDIVAAVAAGTDLEQLTAADLVAVDLVTAQPNHTIAQAAALMIQHRVRHLPIVDAGRIVGVVTALDLLHALTSEQP
jgi:CBS domain-containing protein